jgi:hypothetical protein
MTARLRTLVDFAAENGAKLISERVERIERDLAERPPEVPGLTSQLRSRVAATKLAMAEGNGFAAAWLIEQTEQIVGAINAALTAPMVKAAAGSAGGRVKTQAKRKSNADERWDKILPIVHEIERAIRSDVKFDERWRLVAERYTDKTSDDLPVAAAKKRLPVWRKMQGVRPNVISGRTNELPLSVPNGNDGT